MFESMGLTEALPQAGKEQLRLRPGSPEPRKSPALVPIRSLGENHRARITRHLLALEPHDRYLRFGFNANDEHVQRYADKLDFERDEIFGIYNRRLDLIAMAHLAFSADRNLNLCTEFGVSVLPSVRGRGYGARLFDRAVMHARNEGVVVMFINALSENHAMLKIARNAGAIVECDGPDSEAHLHLPPASLDTVLSELIHEQVARTDYRIKSKVKQFRDLLADVQALRRDVQEAQRISPK